MEKKRKMTFPVLNEYIITHVRGMIPGNLGLILITFIIWEVQYTEKESEN